MTTANGVQLLRIRPTAGQSVVLEVQNLRVALPRLYDNTAVVNFQVSTSKS
jgi:hypothetical protein